MLYFEKQLKKFSLKSRSCLWQFSSCLLSLAFQNHFNITSYYIIEVKRISFWIGVEVKVTLKCNDMVFVEVTLTSFWIAVEMMFTTHFPWKWDRSSKFATAANILKPLCFPKKINSSWKWSSLLHFNSNCHFHKSLQDHFISSCTKVYQNEWSVLFEWYDVMLKWFWNASDSWQLENCHKPLLFKLKFFNCFSKYSTWLHSTSNHYFHKSLHIISLQKHCQLHSFWQYFMENVSWMLYFAKLIRM